MTAKAQIVVGLGFGDEGKGALTDWLAARFFASLVVRYNGGPQAAHNVVTDDLRQHTFSQFGSGVFAGAHSHLSKFVRVDPLFVMEEGKHLVQLGETDVFRRLTIDNRCLVVTPWHRAYSRFRAPIHQRGSCGSGNGQAAVFAANNPDYALVMSDLWDRNITREKLEFMDDYYKDAVHNDPFIQASENIVENMVDFYEAFCGIVQITSETDWQHMRKMHTRMVFEGAQGVWLDKHLGHEPYVTNSNTTTDNAKALLEGWEGNIEVWGCTRSYGTRHGPGPMPGETPALSSRFPEFHNVPTDFTGPMRRGWLDIPTLDKSIEWLGGVDKLAISHMDYWANDFKLLKNLKHIIPKSPLNFAKRLSSELSVPIGMLAYGPRRKDRYRV